MNIKKHLFKVIIFSVIICTFFNNTENKTSIYKQNDVITLKSLKLLENATQALDENTIVVFDVDDTLITPKDKIFHVNSWWQTFLLGTYYVWLTWDFFLSDKLIRYYNQALFNSDWQLVDQSTPALIKKLQNQGVKVIALTGCISGKHGNISAVEDWRIKQLKGFGIDFSSSFCEYNNILLDKSFKTVPPLFKNGIIFANMCPKTKDRTKASVLLEFLERVNFKPKKIFFIDDTKKYLDETRVKLQELKIPFAGLHYTAAEKFLVDIDMNLARFQMRTLIKDKKWISDNNICEAAKN